MLPGIELGDIEIGLCFNHKNKKRYILRTVIYLFVQNNFCMVRWKGRSSNYVLKGSH